MAEDSTELFAVLLSLWRERQRVLESYATDLLTLPPAAEQPYGISLHELLTQQPQHVALHPNQLGAASSSHEHSVQALHARLTVLDATIAMLRGASAAAQNGTVSARGNGTRGGLPARPYLSVDARKRLRLLQSTPDAAGPLPTGGQVPITISIYLSIYIHSSLY